MKNFKLCVLVLVVSLIFLVSCTQEPLQLNNQTAISIVENIKYVRDGRTGICYAVTGSYNPIKTASSANTSVTMIPCSSCEKLLIN